MRFREWLHPHRQLLLALVAVATVSAGALGWLGWLLIQQDARLGRQQQAERSQQQAEIVAAAIRASIADLPRLAAVSPDAGPADDGTLRAVLGPHGVSVREPSRVLWLPQTPEPSDRTSIDLGSAEAKELHGDLAGALRGYLRATRTRPDDATALARIARVQRKLGQPAAALATYDRLDAHSTGTVAGLPASLVARVGRASVHADAGAQDQLRREALALGGDLHAGRWTLTRAEFEFYREQAERWLGRPLPLPDAAVVRAEALEWAWANVRAAREPGTRALRFERGPAVVGWSPDAAGVRAVVLDASGLAAACVAAAGGKECALVDDAGAPLTGGRVRAGPSVRVLTDASGTPWMLRLAGDAPAATPSPRRPLLLYTIGLAGFVLTAGWFFILRAMARESAVARGQADFVAAVSHEFRSPLTSMSHVAELLASGRIAGEAQVRAFDVLVRDTERLRSLVEQLLEFGRFEAGGPVLRLERLDASAIVGGIVNDFQARVARDGYAVSYDGPDTTTWIQGDREALALAIWNLMDNAVKYSPDEKAIWVRLQHTTTGVEIAVRDNGLGIPAREQARIFEQFVRGEEPKARRIRGTGIGLALVRHIARAHGGDISVRSEAGQGSTFTLTLNV